MAAAMLSILLAPQAAVALSKRVPSPALLSAYFFDLNPIRNVALDFSNNWVAFFLYCVIINIIGSGGSLNRNLTDCTGPHAPSEGVGRPKGGLRVVPTRNFTDLLVQLQICNNPQSAWLTCGSGDGRVAQCCIQLWRRMV